MPYVPPWITAADPAGEMLHGFQIGAGIAQERSRLASEQERAGIEAQVRQQELQRQTSYENTRLATEKARTDAEIGLRAANLQRLQEQNAFTMKVAATKMADQQGFAKDLAAGMSVEQALFRHPTLASPTAITQARKDAQDISAQHLQIARDRLAMEQERLDNQENKPGKTGTIDVPYVPNGATDAQKLNPVMVRGLPLDSPEVNTLMGTNAPPGTGTNFVPRVKAPAPALLPPGSPAPAAAAAPYAEGSVVRNKKDQKLYKIVNGVPVAQSEDAE